MCLSENDKVYFINKHVVKYTDFLSLRIAKLCIQDPRSMGGRETNLTDNCKSIREGGSRGVIATLHPRGSPGPKSMF